MKKDEKKLMDKIMKLESQIEEGIAFLESGKYSSVMLLNLINDMMDLAKTEQLKFDINNEYFDLTKTI